MALWSRLWVVCQAFNLTESAIVAVRKFSNPFQKYQSGTLSINKGKTHENFEESLYKTPVQPLDPKRLRVGIIGMPNVGKSTLINALCGRNMMATSSRIDTTTDNVLAVLTEENVQIEFQDTPGIHNRRKSKKIRGKFQSSYLPSYGMSKADLALVVVDLSERRTSKGYLQPEVLLHLLKYPDIPAVLVLNKVDKLTHKRNVLPLIAELTAGVVDNMPLQSEVVAKENEPIQLPKIESSVLHALDVFESHANAADISLANKTEEKVLKQLRQYRGWPNFKEVFVISALRRRTEKLKTYLKSKALSEPWKYHADMITDASPYDLVKDMMRSTMLENLSDEVPYLTEIMISDWEETDKVINIYINLVCQKPKHVLFVEKSSNVLAYGAKKRLRSIFPINVEIHISVNSEIELASY